MKPGLHPKYQEATVTCACGEVFTTRSTRSEIRTDLCSVCHPFYTGEQRIVDTAGQVERFMRRMETAQSRGETRPSKRQQRLQTRSEQLEEQQRRLRDAEARERAAGGQEDITPEAPAENSQRSQPAEAPATANA